MTAVTSEAAYMNESRLLVLTGPDSTVKSGQNSIVGAKITLDRASGRITVENSVENQVKALFFTNGKGLN
jgi:lipopolysaccharide export system protein LptA